MRSDDRGKKKPARRANPIADLNEAEGLLEDMGGKTGARGRKGVKDLKKEAEAWSSDRAFEALRGLATSIVGQLNLRTLVGQILETAVRTLGAERGILFLGRGDHPGLIPVLAIDIRGEELEAIERVSRTILEKSRTGEVILVQDAPHDARFADIPSVQVKQVRSVVCAPLLASGDPVGLLYLDAPSRAGAFPAESGRVLQALAEVAAVALENARVHGELLAENSQLRSRTTMDKPFARILTLHPGMQQVLAKAELAARMDAPVLILGEAGTGRTLLARSIHEAGPRALHPFVSYNCAMSPQDRAERLLFGFRDGHAGSQAEISGFYRQADRGVLFLGDIGSLDASLQAKVWGTLDSGMIRAVGGRSDVRVDVRLIASADPGIRNEVLQGKFHKELFDGLRTLVLHLPPLRERPQDVPLLARYFLRRHSAASGRAEELVFTSNAMDLLQSLPWPGNVRQLETLVRMTLSMVTGHAADAAILEKMLALSPDALSWSGGSSWGGPSGPRVRSIVEHEVEAIREALIQTGGNKSQAAKLLGVHRNTLMRKVAKMDISWRTKSR